MNKKELYNCATQQDYNLFYKKIEEKYKDKNINLEQEKFFLKQKIIQNKSMEPSMIMVLVGLSISASSIGVRLLEKRWQIYLIYLIATALPIIGVIFYNNIFKKNLNKITMLNAEIKYINDLIKSLEQTSVHSDEKTYIITVEEKK